MTVNLISERPSIMMIERRDFLQTAIGAVSAMAIPALHRASVNVMPDPLPEWTTKIEQTLVASEDRELLGIPKSLQCVREGLHPFSPERTLILHSQAHDGRHFENAQQLAQRWGDASIPNDPETFHRIFQAASVLTQAYGFQERTKDWAVRLLWWLFHYYNWYSQDHLWVAPCSWQHCHEPVATSNGIVDWWLILIPQGIEAPSIDGTRLHTLITPVYTEVGKPRMPDVFWYFMGRRIGLLSYDPGAPRTADQFWWKLSRMDAKSACLTVNQRIAENLTQMA